jgi:CPA2 family monovalent cation:H+ antiporter-2
MHDTALIATIAAGIGFAFLLGLAATRLRMPPLVGYLIAGVLVGPHTPGFDADPELAQQLAEIGVILLMFGVGIHFSVEDLLAVRKIALPGAAVQIALATVLGAGVARLWGWSWGSGIVFGVCLSVASTVVLLRALEARGQLDTADGRIAIGWLIVEDLATVIVLVLLPALAPSLGGAESAEAGDGSLGSILVSVGLTLAKVAALFGVMLVVGRRVIPWMLQVVARTGSRELFTLSVLAVALGIAVGSAALFGVSFALGAFIAGMVVNGSDLSHEAATESLPLQDAFSVLFFVAVGMLFDPSILVERPLEVLEVVLIVTLGKSLGAFFIVAWFRHSLRTALTISASLAQIGEFSFILVALALTLGLLPEEAQGLIVAASILSIGLNQAAFWAADRLPRWLDSRPGLRAALERHPGPIAEAPRGSDDSGLRDHVILVGYGRVGSAVGETLRRRGIPYVAIEQDREKAEDLRERGVPAMYGDAVRPGVLAKARVERAKLLVIAAPDPYQARAILELARAANPAIQTVARTHSEHERSYLERHGVEHALIGEHELAFGLAHNSLLRMGCDENQADEAIAAIRETWARPAAKGAASH